MSSKISEYAYIVEDKAPLSELSNINFETYGSSSIGFPHCDFRGVPFSLYVTILDESKMIGDLVYICRRSDIVHKGAQYCTITMNNHGIRDFKEITIAQNKICF